MTRFKRPHLLALYVRRRQTLDYAALFQGHARTLDKDEVVAVTGLDGEVHPVTAEEARVVLEMDAGWTDATKLTSVDMVRQLVQRKVLLSDAPTDDMARRRARDEVLAQGEWERFGALYHLQSRWTDVMAEHPRYVGWAEGHDVPQHVGPSIRAHAEAHGPIPSHHYRRDDAEAVVPLDPPRTDGALQSALRTRRSALAFDGDAYVTREQVTTLLQSVWGAQKAIALSPDLTIVHRTSPSGGGLASIGVYVGVARVEELNPGLYYYDSVDHTLQRLKSMLASEVQQWAHVATAGQSHVSSGSLFFVLAARFRRCFWKYRNNQKSYRVLLLEAGHQLQTLNLVATHLGLSTRLTAAINEIDIETSLTLDGYSEGVLAFCGCGVAT